MMKPNRSAQLARMLVGIASFSVMSWGQMLNQAVLAQVEFESETVPLISDAKGAVILRQQYTAAERLVAQAEADIVDVAIADGSFDTLVELLSQVGIDEDLRGFGRFTVFAPTDAAFEAVPASVMSALAQDSELLAKVLAYHVVASGQPLTSDTLTDGPLTTTERSEIVVDVDGRSVSVNDATVVRADIEASNGVIHAIDEVLIPPSVLERL